MKKEKIRKKILFAMLGATAIFYRLDLKLPTKWYSAIDSLRASTGFFKHKLGSMDEEVEKDFIAREERMEKKLGIRKFYDDKEIEEISRNIEQTTLDT